MAAKGYRFAYIDRVLARYRIHGLNKVLSQPTERISSLERIWRGLVQSDAFSRLTQGVQADFYLRVAVAEILADRRREAQDALREAIARNPRRLLPRLWLTALLILGSGIPKRLIMARRGLLRWWRLARGSLALRFRKQAGQ